MSAPDDVTATKFLKQAHPGADTAPPMYSGPQEDLPKYEPGPDQAVAPDLRVMGIIVDVMSSPAGKKALRQAIDELGDSAFSIEVSFTTVARGLVEAYAAASTRDTQQEMSQFQGDWEQYRKNYINLLWLSRVVAGHARTAAKDFAKNVVGLLKDDNIQLTDKKEEIKGYRKQLAVSEDIKNSQSLSQGFTDLQTNIREFQGRIVAWLKRCEPIQHSIEQLLGDIKRTNEEIKMLTKQMLISAVSSLALAGVSAGALAIGIICPPLWIGAAAAGIHAVEKGMNLLKHTRTRDAQLTSLVKEQKAELDRLRVKLSGVQTIYTIVNPLQPDMVLIHEKLGTFSGIWSCIRADLVEIEESMELVTTTETPLLFKKRLDAIQQIYLALCDALYQYETRVHTQPGFAVYK